MNRALLDPFQSTSLPETVEEYLEQGVTKCVAFNRRGTILAAGCLNGDIVLWDFDTRGVLRVFTGHSGSVNSVAWSRNGRQLLSASQSGQLLLFDVLSGEIIRRVTLNSPPVLVQVHPADNTQGLASCVGGAPLLVNLVTGSTRALPLTSPTLVDDTPTSTGTRRGAQESSGGLAVFSKDGDRAFVGSSKGFLLVVDLKTFSVLDGLKVPGGSSVKGLFLNRTGTTLLVNSGDRTIRVFDVGQAASSAPGERLFRFARDFQNAVSKVPWTAATLSADSDFVIGSSGSSGEHLLYVWDRQHGTLEKILEGPQSASVIQVAWHPKRPVLAAVSGDGRVYLWARLFTENWSAFAPDFQELEENEEYVEREDEFDAVQEAPVLAKPAVEEDDLEVDVETVDPALADTSEDDEPDPLHYLPLEPERDERFLRQPSPPPQPDASAAAAAAPVNSKEPSLLDDDVLQHEGSIPIGMLLSDSAGEILMNMDNDDEGGHDKRLLEDADEGLGMKRLRSASR